MLLSDVSLFVRTATFFLTYEITEVSLTMLYIHKAIRKAITAAVTDGFANKFSMSIQREYDHCGANSRKKGKTKSTITTARPRGFIATDSSKLPLSAKQTDLVIPQPGQGKPVTLRKGQTEKSAPLSFSKL